MLHILPRDKSHCYEIVVSEHLDLSRSEWFDALTLTHGSNGETRLSGPIADRAALYGVLARVRDLGLTLIALKQLDSPASSK
jgi:hypothetical protein